MPLGPADARELLEGLKGWPLLAGVRGDGPGDVEALCELVAGLSRFAWLYRDEIAEIDLNPVIVHREGRGVTVVDALIVRRGGDEPAGSAAEAYTKGQR